MDWEEELRRLRAQLQGVGVPQTSVASGATGGRMLTDIMRNRPTMDLTQITPEMIAAADDSQLRSEEKRFSNQRKIAQQMRDAQMPGGRNVGGPSNAFVVNPYEQAATAGKRLLGAWMDKDTAREEEEALSPLRQSVQQGQAALQSAKAQNELAAAMGNFQSGLYGTDVTAATAADAETGRNDRYYAGLEADSEKLAKQISADADAAEAKRLADAAAAQAALDASRADAQTQRTQELEERSPVNVIGPAGDIIRAETDILGNLYIGGQQVPDQDKARYPVATGGSEGNLTPLQQQTLRQQAIDDLLAGEDKAFEMEQFSNEIDRSFNPEIAARFGGMTNVPGWLASEYGIGQEAWMAQDQQSKMNLLKLRPLATASKIFKPFSNYEVQIADAPLPDLRSEPETAIGFYTGYGRDELNKMYRSARQSLRNDPEALAALDNQAAEMFDQYDAAMTEKLARVAIAENKVHSAEEVEQLGLNPLEYMDLLERLRRGQ